MRKELYPVVLIRIVRGRNNDASVKIVLTDEAGDAWRREHSRKRNRSPSMREARGNDGSDVKARLAGIRSNQSVRRRMIAMEKSSDRDPQREKSGVIERGCSGDTSDAVRSKELSRHKVNRRQMVTDKKSSTAFAESREVGRRMC